MAEKKVPAIKPVGKPDGIPKGGGYNTITTPSFDKSQGNGAWSTGTDNHTILGKT